MGDAKAGKTSIKSTYHGMEYIDNYHITLGVETGLKLFDKHALHIFDIGGQKGFTMDEYFGGTQGAVIVF